MREDSIFSGNVNSKINSECQVYDLEQEYNVYVLYTLYNIRLGWQSFKSQERGLNLTMCIESPFIWK